MRKQKELGERMLAGEAVKQQGIRDLEEGNKFAMNFLYFPIFRCQIALKILVSMLIKFKAVCWNKCQSEPDLWGELDPHSRPNRIKL